MTTAPHRCLWGILLLWPSLAGCGLDELFVSVDKRKPTVVADGGAGDGDAGDGDLGDGDGGDGDRDGLDGSVGGGDGDGSSGDGDLGLDGAMADGALNGDGDGVLPDDCLLDTEAVWSDDVPFGDEGGHALSPGGSGFGVAYRVDEGCDEIRATNVASTGPLPTAVPVLGQASCTAFRDLALLRVSDRWHLAWVDNATGSAELHHQVFDASMGEDEMPERISDNDEPERHPALTRVGDNTLLSWIQGGDTARGVWTHVLGAQESTEVIPAGGAHLPVRLAASPMGGGGAALAWVNEEGDRGVWLQPIDADGRALGKPQELTDFASAGSTVDLSARTRGGTAELGGAAVYSVIVNGQAREVRFRRLDTAGKPIEDERTLIGQPYRAQDASITEIGDGYVVAYRALPDGTVVTNPEIRMVFVTREGTVARDGTGRAISHKIADATLTGGRITIRASIEGQLLLSWLDFNATTGENALKMTRQRLDCR